MRYTKTLVAALMAAALAGNGCQSAPKRTVLPAPAGTNTAAAHHNDEGMQAYEQGRWDTAQQHFVAAITAAPDLAEAHYNLGRTLYRLGAIREGDAHFITAANLAPGNKVIWDSPPLKNVYVPSRDAAVPGLSDGHAGHAH